MGPRLLQPDNITPPARTPWGGRRIPERYKSSLGISFPVGPVGESWEVSVEPSFPSRLADTGELLSDAIALRPEDWIGFEVARRYGGALPLLVKLLDSAADLSVQVHPPEGHATLLPEESGKPEAWLVLEADPGAGIFLGWREGVERRDVEDCLEASGQLNQLMNYIEVMPGDVYMIPPGCPHGIAAGVTLLEPQIVQPGRRGVTYRFWDWNRRYDAMGRVDPRGEARPLHIAKALDSTDWSAPRGEALCGACRSEPRTLESGSMVRRQLLRWPHFRLELWEGSGHLLVPNPGTLWALTCLAGKGRLSCGAHCLILPMGQSAVVPAAAGDLRVEGDAVVLAATRL